jgi:hypothetical protein
MSETNDPMAEVEELVSALVDEVASEDQIRRLKELLQADSEARRVYLTCMRMHSDLHFLQGSVRFQQPPDITGVRKSRKSKTLPPPAVEPPLPSDATKSEELANSTSPLPLGDG